MRIVALDNYDNIQEGTEYECPDHQAQRLIAKGLAKSGPLPLNKMAGANENKSNPSEADGEARLSSASQAAPASLQTTAQSYPGGGLVTPDSRFAEATPESVTERAKRAPAKKVARKSEKRAVE
jgi:hypothetical protein